MNHSVGDKYVSELKELFTVKGPQLYSGEHSLCLTSACLNYIQRKLATLQDEAPSSTNGKKLTALTEIHECLNKVKSLKLIADRKNTVAPSLINIDLSVFKSAQSLVLKRIPVGSLINLRRLREQLTVLVIQRSHLHSLEDILVLCGGDKARAFAWKSLRELDLSINYIKTLGEPLQFLPEVEYLNISNNQIGPSGLSSSSSNSTSSISSTERQDGLLPLAGVQYIDKVKTLHLGFNQLTCVPEFGERAKYNLTCLILRNNRLKDVIGVEVLDSLIELDISENLISKSSALNPLLNLHNLNQLSVLGNPICYDNKYRHQIIKCLSNLISPITFLLDGKKLTNAERKFISQTLTHYSPPTTPLITPSPSPSPYHMSTGRLPHYIPDHTPAAPSPIPVVLVPKLSDRVKKYEEDEVGVKMDSLPLSSYKMKRKSSVKRKPRVILLDAEEETDNNLRDTSLSTSNSSSTVPLLNEEGLTKHSDLRTLLKDSWLSTAESFPKGSEVTKLETEELATEATKTDSHVSGTGTSPPDPLEEVGGDWEEFNGVEEEEEIRSFSPVHTGPTPQVTGNIFDVSVWDSDTDEERPHPLNKDTWISISDRFLQEIEISTNTVQDQLDLQCLKSAVINTRYFKGVKKQVLVLNFAYDRRDRRKREYVLSDDIHEQKKIIDQLEPIVQSNNSAISIATKLECFKCQVVIDWFEALDAPQTTPTSLRPSPSDTQLAKLCPHCKGFLIQINDTSSNSGSLPARNQSLAYFRRYSGDDLNSTNDSLEDSTREEETPLSPGHIDVSQFSTYPDSNSVSPSRLSPILSGHNPIPLRLSPIPPSPHPDMTPFHTPCKPSTSKLINNQGAGLNGDSTRREEDEDMNNELQLEEDEEIQFGFGSKSNPDQLFKYRPLNPFDNLLTTPTTSSLSSLSNEQKVNHTNPFTDLSDNKDETKVTQTKSLSGTHSRTTTRNREQEPVSKTKPILINKSRSTLNKSDTPPVQQQVISASVPASESKIKSYISTLMRGKREEEDGGDKSRGHYRSKSQDIKVPPLPSTIKDRSIDKHVTRGETTHASGHTSDERKTPTERPGSSGSGSGKRLGLFNVTSVRSKRSSQSKGHHLSSSETEESKTKDNQVLPYRDSDPCYIHSNFNIYLTLEVFDSEKGEKFELAIKTTIIEYGDWNETESFVIFSNQSAYIYKVTAPASLTPDSWLELKKTISLKDLVYIIIGVGYQSLRLEFDCPPQCYTFLIRNEEQCKKLFDKLSYVVSDVSRSKFRGIKVSQLSLTTIKDPHQALKEALKVNYNTDDSPKKIEREEEEGDEEESEEEVKIFLLAHKYIPQNDPSLVPVTLVLTSRYIYLALDNPQWPLPKLHPLPDKCDLLPPYSGVIQKDITDVEKLILYDDQTCQFTLQFFQEVSSSSAVSHDLSCWTIVVKTSKSIQKFVKLLEQLWLDKFQLTLQKEFR